METTDILYCTELISTTAATIMNQFEQQEKEIQFSDLIAKFKTVNETVAGLLRNGLAARFPQIAWADNEFNIQGQRNPEIDGLYWVCDPLDGGVHYMQGFAPWCITLALIQNNRVVFSVVYEPVRKEMFYALENGGAFLNGQQISISAKKDLSMALVGTAHPNHMKKDQADTALFLKYMEQLTKDVFGIRMLGPAALQLAYVACGRLDGYGEPGDDLYDWLAGSLLVKEAGGIVSSYTGNTFTFDTNGIIAANPALHPLLLPG